MSRTLEEANRAIMRVRDLPYGPARNEVAATLVREIDADGPEGALAFALHTLVESYTFGAEIEKAYLPFTRSVRLWDERPELFDAEDEYSLFWSFKWMVGDLMRYPTVPAGQIQATLDDMERRFQVAGNGLSAVNHLRFEWSRILGSEDLDGHYEAWVRTERDDFSQCQACEPGDRARYLFEAGRWDEGIRLLEQAEQAGLTCHTEPGDMLSQLQLAYLEVGDAEGAARAHRRALRSLDDSGEMSAPRGRHVQFLARTGNADAALRLLTDYQRLLTHAESPYDRWEFLTEAGVGVAALSAQDPTAAITLEDVPATTVEELDGWMRAEATGLAAAFDRRGGTAATGARTVRAWSGAQVHVPVDLSVLTAAGPASGVVGAESGPADALDGSGVGADALVDQAEMLARQDPVAAARLYAQASAAFAAQDHREAAGFALAEAAVLSDQVGDPDGAAEAAASALALLRSAGTGAQFAGPVARTTARLLCARDEADRAVRLLAEVLEGTEAELAAAQAELDLAQPDAETAGPLARRVRNLQVERAQLLDTTARALASAREPASAVAAARRAAEEFAAHGLVTDAAYAFWLAGTLEHSAGDAAQAAWLLESAAEGFALARDRATHAQVVGELVRALTALGRLQEAESLVRSLAE